MQLIEENCVQWTIDVDNVGSTCNFEFKDVSKREVLLNTVNSLLTAPQKNLSTDQSISEDLVADEETKDHHPVDSEMVVEELAHNLNLLKTEAKSKTRLNIQQLPLVLEDKTKHINISEVEVDNEPENVIAHSERRLTANSKPNSASDDLLDTTVPLQASSRDNSRSENEIANAVTEDIIQCSEVESLPIYPVGTVQSSDAVNQPTNSSYTVEVTTICYDSCGSCYCNKVHVYKILTQIHT